MLSFMLAAAITATPAELPELRARANRHDGAAERLLGERYLYGKQVPLDQAQAARWFRRASDDGDAQGAYDLAYVYEHGMGLPEDAAQARGWYQHAANMGLVTAEYQLGYMAEMGIGGPIDRQQARRYYGRSSGLGYAQGSYALGCLEWSDHRREALRYFRLTAQQANPTVAPLVRDVYYFLGQASERGEGTRRDPAAAAAWYRQGAALEEPGAMLRLGRLAATGTGLKRDPRLAEELFTKALPHGRGDREGFIWGATWLGQRKLHDQNPVGRVWLLAAALRGGDAAANLLAANEPDPLAAYTWATVSDLHGNFRGQVLRCWQDLTVPKPVRLRGRAAAKQIVAEQAQQQP